MSEQRILLVGGAGYVGSQVGIQLSDEGRHFHILDNFQNASKSKADLEQLGWSYSEVDIREAEVTDDAIRRYAPTHVVHLAALHYIPECNAAPKVTVETNVGGLLNVANTVSRLPTEPVFIFISSAAVYAGKDPVCREDDKVAPDDIYGMSKYAGELIVTTLLKRYRIARLFNVYGMKDPYPHLIPKVYRTMIQKKDLRLGSAESERDFVHVNDVARALNLLLHYSGKQQIFNIGTGSTVSVRGVVGAIQDTFNITGDVTYFHPEDMRVQDKPILCADTTLAATELGWSPAYSFAKGLETLR